MEGHNFVLFYFSLFILSDFSWKYITAFFLLFFPTCIFPHSLLSPLYFPVLGFISCFYFSVYFPVLFFLSYSFVLITSSITEAWVHFCYKFVKLIASSIHLLACLFTGSLSRLLCHCIFFFSFRRLASLNKYLDSPNCQCCLRTLLLRTSAI